MPGPKEGWEAYCKAAKDMGLKPLVVMVSMERRSGICQTEADSIDEVKKAHEVAHIPLEDVYEVTVWDPA